jgi:hypothetical protein
MKYRFPKNMEVDFSALKKFVKGYEELTKDELLERSAGKIGLDLFQTVKELEFSKIGKDEDGELYIR